MAIQKLRVNNVDYNTLENKPTEIAVSGWEFTKNTGNYSKPSGGIPESDLASEQQTKINSGDTVTYEPIDSLIDAKIGTLESLANEISEVFG